MMMKIRKVMCWVLGHNVKVIGANCSQKKPHYCTKGRLLCIRCGRVHYTTPGGGEWL